MGRNPLMSRVEGTVTGAQSAAYQASYAGVVLKTTLLFALLGLSGFYTGYQLIETGQLQGGVWTLFGSAIGAFIAVIIATVKPRLAPFFSIIYALLEGVFLGAISAIYTLQFGDMIVPTALVSTGGVFVAMLLLYRSGIITVGPLFRRILYTMLVGIMITYLFMFIASFFGFFESAFGMDIYLLVVIISAGLAAFFLLIDFDNIKSLVDAGADKQYEWVLSLTLVVTVVWLYIELLKILAILSSDR